MDKLIVEFLSERMDLLIVHIEPFGICFKPIKNISNDYTIELPFTYLDTDILAQVVLKNIFQNIEVFITDPGKSTNFGISLASHQGEKMKILPGKAYAYDVKIVMTDLNNPKDGTDCQLYESSSYADCVDQKIYDIMLKVNFSKEDFKMYVVYEF